MSTRLTDKDSVGIIIKAPSTGPYYCNSDNFRLALQDKETGEYICASTVTTSYYPSLEKVKKGNKFETPAGRDHMPLVSLVKDSNTETFLSISQAKDISPPSNKC